MLKVMVLTLLIQTEAGDYVRVQEDSRAGEHLGRDWVRATLSHEKASGKHCLPGVPDVRAVAGRIARHVCQEPFAKGVQFSAKLALFRRLGEDLFKGVCVDAMGDPAMDGPRSLI